MIEFGVTLRRMREEKGLSVSEVAEKTHMLVQQVEALEREDFSKIAAPIYGRGFVKLYCEAVGIEDPKPFVNEFMDIFTGNRPPTIRMRPSAPAAPAEVLREPPEVAASSGDEAWNPAKDDEPSAAGVPPEEPSAEPAREPSQAQSVPETGSARQDAGPAPSESDAPPAITGDLFNFALESEIIKPGKKKAEPPAAPSDGNGGAAADAAENSARPSAFKTRGPSRYAAPQPLEYEEERRFSIPPVYLRVGVLALGAALLIWLIFSGVSCVYNATMSPAPADEGATAAEAADSGDDKASGAAPAAKEPRKRVPMKLPELYID